jgi:uncharacterized protein YggE
MAPHGAAIAADSTAPQQQIVVSGEGTVRAQPDLAVVSVGVTQIAPTSTEAMNLVNRAQSAVIDSIKALGIADRDIQTSGLSLQPNYKPRRANDDSPPEIDSYRASNNVTVTVRNLNQAGPVLDAATGNGANSIGGIRFGFANEQQLRLQALANATTDAGAKAQAIAGAASVGPLVLQSITEDSVASPQPLAFAAAPRAAGVDSVQAPVQAGELTITARVHSTYTF